MNPGAESTCECWSWIEQSHTTQLGGSKAQRCMVNSCSVDDICCQHAVAFDDYCFAIFTIVRMALMMVIQMVSNSEI